MKLTMNILAYQIWILNQPFMGWKEARDEAEFWMDYAQTKN